MYRSPDQLLRSLKMVKLEGPGLAQQAAGQLAHEITFSNWKGRAYLKKHAKPKQPRTKPQLAMRAVLAFLTAQWSTIPEDRQETWLELAAARNISPINAYQAYNAQRWRNFKAPSQIYPATEVLPWSGYPHSDVYGMPRAARHVITNGDQHSGWAFLIHHLDDAGDDRRWDNLAHVLPTPTEGDWTWVQRGLTPGAHYFMHTNFSIDGNMRDYSWLRSCTVTD